MVGPLEWQSELHDCLKSHLIELGGVGASENHRFVKSNVVGKISQPDGLHPAEVTRSDEAFPKLETFASWLLIHNFLSESNPIKEANSVVPLLSYISVTCHDRP